MSNIILTLMLNFLAFSEPNTNNAVEAQPKMPVIKFEEYDLNNGLHVILHQDNKLPIVTTYLYYHVGSKNEDPQRTGFAHFFEHLMFEGTEHIPRGQIDKLISSSGGVLNASTGFDYTDYFFTLPSNQLELALWIESERIRVSKIDEVGVSTQREVVKEERRKNYENRPYGSLFEHLAAMVFKNTQYSWLPIGSAQYIDKATLSEFKDFYKKFYVPNNAVLVISGDFQTADAKKLVDKYFGFIPKGPNIVQPKYVFSLDAKPENKVVEEDKTPLPASIFAWRIPAEDHEDSPALDVLGDILSSGQSSRLYRKLVSTLTIANNVSAGTFRPEGAGIFYTFTVGNPTTTLEELDKAINEELTAAIEKGVSAGEVKKVLNQMITQKAGSYTTVASRARGLGYYHTVFKDANRINKELDKYKNLTVDDINRVAKKYLIDARKYILHYPVVKKEQP